MHKLEYVGGPRAGQPPFVPPPGWAPPGLPGVKGFTRVAATSEAKRAGIPYGVYELDKSRPPRLVWKELPTERKFIGGPRDGRDAAHAYDKTIVRCDKGVYHLRVQPDGSEAFVFTPRTYRK